MQFFKAIRNAIATDSLPSLIELIAKQSLSADIPLSIETKWQSIIMPSDCSIEIWELQIKSSNAGVKSQFIFSFQS